MFVVNPLSVEWVANLHRGGVFILGNFLFLLGLWIFLVAAETVVPSLGYWPESQVACCFGAPGFSFRTQAFPGKAMPSCKNTCPTTGVGCKLVITVRSTFFTLFFPF